LSILEAFEKFSIVITILIGYASPLMSAMTVNILKIVVPFLVMFQIIPLLIWLERKGSAYIQDRPGPNRAAIQGVRLGGLFHALADVLKLITKEDIIPNHVNKIYYLAAPVIALTIACITFVVFPFAAPITIAGEVFTFQAANLNAGVLYILAVTSISVYGIMLAGWSSNNKYALLGGLRSSAQMISYELCMGLALMSLLMWTGSLGMNDIVTTQTQNVWRWNFMWEPIACLILIVSAFAECNRAPFDLPESESELVAGYHIEYSSMKFAMFFMAEYANMIIASALIITLFFGGWQVPFMSTTSLQDHAGGLLTFSLIAFSLLSLAGGFLLTRKYRKGKYGDKRDFEPLILGSGGLLVGFILIVAAILLSGINFSLESKMWIAAVFQILTFITKTLIMCWVFIWVRWTLPRIRYDQLMNLGWKFMLPLAMANVVITALRMYF